MASNLWRGLPADGQVSDYVAGDLLVLRDELLRLAEQRPDAATALGYLQLQGATWHGPVTAALGCHWFWY